MISQIGIRSQLARLQRDIKLIMEQVGMQPYTVVFVGGVMHKDNILKSDKFYTWVIQGDCKTILFGAEVTILKEANKETLIELRYPLSCISACTIHDGDTIQVKHVECGRIDTYESGVVVIDAPNVKFVSTTIKDIGRCYQDIDGSPSVVSIYLCDINVYVDNDVINL